MGMLLRRKSESVTMTTAADLKKKPVAKVEEVRETVKDEKPKTVKRGRPIKK